ncbi:MAG TPA: crosslink repair DNA glycosylase YcaQ family protein [bacterium]|nr:crosslink repair DNA glycosylase YcaQ family protein [bacterium]
MPITLDDLRRFAVAHSLFTPTTLKRALYRLGFVQADPIRAPARAQDLMLRHRVKDYRAGDLERRYAKLGIEEDFFVTYGFVTRAIHALMHPRPDIRVPAEDRRPWPAARRKQAQLLLEFVRERGAVHPREVDDHFSHGTVRNYWGGSSNATTQLLDAMHYRGLLRVARREGGIRIYTAHQHGPGPADAAARRAQIDRLVDVAVRIYAPLPGASLSYVVRRLRFAVPQWLGELNSAVQRAKHRLSHLRVDGVDWYWPAGDDAARHAPRDTVHLLAPFDPVVRDRARFELLWGWVYRFEAYTPAPKRKLGYYALPLLWRDRVIGWGNLSAKNGTLKAEFGYVGSHPPHDRVFKRELEAELGRLRAFLGLES